MVYQLVCNLLWFPFQQRTYVAILVKRNYQPGQQVLKQIQQEARARGYETCMKNIFYFPLSLPVEIIFIFKVLLRCLLFWKGLTNLSIRKNYSFPILCSNSKLTIAKFISAA